MRQGNVAGRSWPKAFHVGALIDERAQRALRIAVSGRAKRLLHRGLVLADQRGEARLALSVAELVQAASAASASSGRLRHIRRPEPGRERGQALHRVEIAQDAVIRDVHFRHLLGMALAAARAHPRPR